ncbi:putative hydrolase of the HAD superfamily [Poseidonocella pacifica]|uniref:Putative hydrolase of the HAD superfamily n=1 Tax=Poseidonocella pacifica TaxID=871651 RepID=A0A1I0XHS4_9RHOB|nr:HAD family hydrolase [Poseidonocella pacifica]SFB00649.1 putative hydrolase of the HAD superfamily [Poseidonocella pacifica]
MTRKLSIVGFDADDTLWHNERVFKLSQDRFAALLADETPPENLMARLEAAERRNLGHYGYGVKGFTLSMIETAIEVTDGRASATTIQALIDIGREMLEHPIELLEGAREAVESVSRSHRVLLITKGDLLDQERKLAQSGLGDLFHGVEVVSEKTPTVYETVFQRHGSTGEHALMVGNSLKSDVLPVIETGGFGVYLPHALTWALERADPPESSHRFYQIEQLSALGEVLSRIEGDA